jgi:two-component system cell cycle response regulator
LGLNFGRPSAELQRVLATDAQSLWARDRLTGLANRGSFLLLAEQQVKHALRADLRAWIVRVDLEGLDQINASFGRQAGDSALREVADILRGVFRHSEILARLGGEAFAACLLDSDDDALGALRQRLDLAVRFRNDQPGARYFLALNVSAVASDRRVPRPLNELLAAADAVMGTRKQLRPGAHPRSELGLGLGPSGARTSEMLIHTPTVK